jgi:hypothetical protein
MHLGRAVGYGLLALIDAFVPAVIAAAITWLALPSVEIAGISWLTWGLLVGVSAFAVTLAASVLSHYRGGKPFAFTRLARTVFDRFLYWSTWLPWG